MAAAIVVVEHEAFGADGRALDHLAGAAGDEDDELARAQVGGDVSDDAGQRDVGAPDGSSRVHAPGATITPA